MPAAFQSAPRRIIPGAVATAGVDQRVAFLRRTYGHLAGAIAAFVALEFLLFQTSIPLRSTLWMASSEINMLLVFGAFIAAGYVARKWAYSGGTVKKQYMGLGLSVVAWAFITMPLLFLAAGPEVSLTGQLVAFTRPHVVAMAGILTLLLFGGVTATVFITRKDFSFLRGVLSVVTFAALGLIVCALLFGFSLGLWFSVAIVALACGYVLYDTSQILAYYPPTAHVAAALALFADIALMFYYVLQIMMSMSRR